MGPNFFNPKLTRLAHLLSFASLFPTLLNFPRGELLPLSDCFDLLSGDRLAFSTVWHTTDYLLLTVEQDQNKCVFFYYTDIIQLMLDLFACGQSLNVKCEKYSQRLYRREVSRLTQSRHSKVKKKLGGNAANICLLFIGPLIEGM